MEHADGRIIWACESARREEAEDGSASICGVLMDVTERKRREVALWKNEERVRALLRGAPDAMILTDAEGLVVNMNDQAEALLDYQLADIVGSSIDHLFPDRLRARMPEMRGAFERDPQRRSLIDGHTFAVVQQNGAELPVELSMSLITGPDESPHILCSLHDLTARRRVEAQLRSSERRLREIANVLPAMVCFVDSEQRYRFANDSYARFHGWEQRQMEGRLMREVIGESAYGQFEPSIAAALEGAASHFRGDVSDSVGARVPVDVSLVPQHDEHGETAGYFVVIFDITDEVAARESDRRHRAELAHVSRVATLGELAASIAHELNQPLSAIVTNAQAAMHFLGASPPDPKEAREALEDISKDGKRAGQVIASMRQLLRRGEIREDSVEVRGLVESVADLLHSEAIGRGVELVIDNSDHAFPSVLGDEIQLKQVFLNLLMNAIEATSRATTGPGAVTVSITLEGAELEIEVRDTGPGLPEGDPEELFTAFVSKRSDGLGMGLAISRTIVEAHNGRLWAEPTSGGGAVFKVRLPLNLRPSQHRTLQWRFTDRMRTR
jgi:PAS domain S-box-containing protein